MISSRENILGLGSVALSANALDVVRHAHAKDADTPEAVARDETYWGKIAQAYSLDDRYVLLNGGGNDPHPTVSETLQKTDIR